MLRADLLADLGRQVYLVIEVLANPHGIFLSVTDFAANGVTFDPQEGHVSCIEEDWGVLINCLSELPMGTRFIGEMGLLVSGGHLAFFRRRWTGDHWLRWETTGFVTDFRWFQDEQLSVQVAFEKKGPYHMKITSIMNGDPPVTPTRSEAAYTYGYVSVGYDV